MKIEGEQKLQHAIEYLEEQEYLVHVVASQPFALLIDLTNSLALVAYFREGRDFLEELVKGFLKPQKK